MNGRWSALTRKEFIAILKKEGYKYSSDYRVSSTVIGFYLKKGKNEIYTELNTSISVISALQFIRKSPVIVEVKKKPKPKPKM